MRTDKNLFDYDKISVDIFIKRSNLVSAFEIAEEIGRAVTEECVFIHKC